MTTHLTIVRYGTPEQTAPEMDAKHIAPLAIVALAIAGVMADVALKAASAAPRPLSSPWFAAGALAYAATAVGWVYVLQHTRLAVVGALYCVFTLLLLVAAGVVLFRESLRPSEALAVALAVASVWLLRRFA